MINVTVDTHNQLALEDTLNEMIAQINAEEVIVDEGANLFISNGFTTAQRLNTSMLITITGGDYIFSISPIVAPFSYFHLGVKYEKSTTQTVVFDDTVDGLKYVYFDEDTLVVADAPTESEIADIIINHTIVAYFYWDATAKEYIVDIFDERHGISMSPSTHVYNHYTRGAQYMYGLGLGGFVIGAGTLATHAQFSVAVGQIADEDVDHLLESDLAVGATIPVVYVTGPVATPLLQSKTQAGFAVLNKASGRVYYNQNDAGTYKLTEVTDNDYVLYHLFATNGLTNRIISVMGQNQYTNASDAKEGASQEISNLLMILEIEELVPLGTVIFNTKNTYTNTVKAKIVEYATGVPYVDWRTTELAQGVPATSHANLTDVSQAGAGVSQGHISDQAQTIAGAKSFSSDVTLTVNGGGINIKSPNGTAYKVTVSDAGVLVVTPI